MTVNVEQIQRAVIQYADAEIAQKATGITKFATYFAIAAFQDKIPKLIVSAMENPIIKNIGVFDSNGNIIIDDLYRYAKTAISKSGKITVYGIIFDENDIDKMWEYLKKQVG